MNKSGQLGLIFLAEHPPAGPFQSICPLVRFEIWSLL